MNLPIKIILILGFVFVMLFPTLNDYINFADNTNTENKTLLKKPDFKINKIGKWVNKFEKYYSNNFGGRSLLFKTISQIKIKIFNTSILPKKAVMGKDNFVFLGDDHSAVITETLGTRIYSEKYLFKIKKRVEAITKKFKKLNTNFYLFIPSNKHTIYPEKLQFNIPKNIKKLDQLIKNGIDLIDMRPYLLDKKRENEKLYYKTDSHWTPYGAYLGYGILMDEIKIKHPNLKTIRYQNFAIDSMLNCNHDLSKVLDANICEYLYQLKYNGKGDIKLRKGSIRNKMTYINKDAPNDLEVMILRDSFSLQMERYLNLTFRKVTYLRSGKIDFGFVKKENPDIFILEIVERGIDKLPFY